MAVRTFLALDADEGIRAALVDASRRLEHCGANFKPVEEGNLHVTLNFLGDVADDLLAEVCSRAAGAAAAVECFDFDVKGLLCVPPRGPLRMVWAVVTDPSGRMARLQANLTEEMEGLGLRGEERGFRPHITLARIKYATHPQQFHQAVAELAGKHFGIQHAEELVTYASRLTPSGPVYTPLAKAVLGE
jgi:2'-5' RNA ligase